MIDVVQNIEPMENAERSILIRERLFECIHNGDIKNDDLVQIFERIADILNLQTITEYAKNNNLSYNGALKRNLKYIERSNIKFIIDKD